MNFKEYYISDNNGQSNCVIRSLCKIYNDSYDNVLNELKTIASELNESSFNEIIVFETYMKRHNTFIFDNKKDVMVKDLNLGKGNYIIFCWDKKDFYHMVPIINNNIYDKDERCLDLFVISIYKQNILIKK